MEKPTYFRRCHLCNTISCLTNANKVDRCEHCEKPFAKFHYFDDRFSPVQGDRNLRPAFLNGEYVPIQGLTVYWESF